VSLRGTSNRSFLACSTDLRIASGTSPALPSPTPTCPCPSPTPPGPKEKRRPPLTTLARLIATTRRSGSSALASFVLQPLVISSKRESAARAAGQRLHPPVIIAASVEETGPCPGFRPLRDGSPTSLAAARFRPLELGAELGARQSTARGSCPPRRRSPGRSVVQARNTASAAAPRCPHPSACGGADLPTLDFVGQHYLAPAFLPTFLRMCSSAYLMPLPL
jgi:hypothetical protein